MSFVRLIFVQGARPFGKTGASVRGSGRIDNAGVRGNGNSHDNPYYGDDDQKFDQGEPPGFAR